MIKGFWQTITTKIMNIFKILKLSLCSMLLFSHTVYSEVKLGKDLTLTPSIGAASQKIAGTSGAVANRNQPSLNAGLSLNHTSGLYALYSVAQDEQDSASVAAMGNYSYEACGVLGFNKGIDAVTLDFSFEDCYVGQRTNKRTGTFYTTATFTASKQLDFSATYFKDDTDGALGANGTSAQTYLVSGKGFNLAANYLFPIAKATLRYGVNDNFTNWYKISFAKEFAGLNFDLAFWNVNSEGNTNFVSLTDQKVNDRQHIILNVSKSF